MQKNESIKLAGICVLVVGAAIASLVNAAEKTTEVTTTTTTIITENTVREKTKWMPLRVCVLDFTSLDIMGQKRFLDADNRPIEIPAQSTLNDADRKSMNSVMQGLVRMIDARDNTRTNDANRNAQIDDNAFNRGKAIELYDTTVKGESRPMIAGAEYLTAYLGRHGDVFNCIDSSLMVAAMDKVRQWPGFPQDFMLKLARETGATHLIHGTVTDLRTRVNSFKGYGIETKTTNYQLDVIIKVVDLINQHTVYANVYTGNYREQRPISGTQFDNNIFQTLMTSALEQAAEDLYEKSKPGSNNRITASPMPYKIIVQVSGGTFFKANSAEIYIDGVHVGNGGETFSVLGGRHTVEIKSSGYQTQNFEINVATDQVINIKLEK